MGATRIRDANRPAVDSKARLNADILRALINAKGITIAELATRSGVHKSTIFRLMSGEVSGRADTARALARALDTTVETLYVDSAV